MTAEKSSAKLNRELQKLLPALDVDMIGIARISNLKGTGLARAARVLLPKGRSIIVLGREIYPEFLELVAPEKSIGRMRLHEIFRSHIDYLSERLDHAAYEVAQLLRGAGFSTLPLSSRRIPTDPVSLHAVISYLEAAQAAGLGKVGMSGLLITHKYGPRLRLALCITEALLKSTARDIPPACRYCNICVAKCPARALERPKDNKPYSLNQFACQAYITAKGGCAECMRVCPVASPKYA